MTIRKKTIKSIWARQRPQRSKSSPCCLTPQSAWILNTNCKSPYNGKLDCKCYQETPIKLKLLNDLGWKSYSPVQSRSLGSFSPKVKCDYSKNPISINSIDKALCKAIRNRKYFISDPDLATNWYRSQYLLPQKRAEQSSQKIAYIKLFNEIHGFNIRASQFERISPQFLFLLQKYHSDISLLQYPHMTNVTPVLNKWNYNNYPLKSNISTPEEKPILKLSNSDIELICFCKENTKIGCCTFLKRLLGISQNKDDFCSDSKLTNKRKRKEGGTSLKDFSLESQFIEQSLTLSKSSVHDLKRGASKVKFLPGKGRCETVLESIQSEDTKVTDSVLKQDMKTQKPGEEFVNSNQKSVQLLLPLKSILKKPSVTLQLETEIEQYNYKSLSENQPENEPKTRKSRSFIRGLRTKRTPTPVSSNTFVNTQDSKILLQELWRKMNYNRETSAEGTSADCSSAEKRVENKLKRLYAGFDRYSASVASYVGVKPVLSLHELHKGESFSSEVSDDEDKNCVSTSHWQNGTRTQGSPRFTIKGIKPPTRNEYGDEENERKNYKYPSSGERIKLRATAMEHKLKESDVNQKNQNERNKDHHVSRYERYAGKNNRNNVTKPGTDEDEIEYNETPYADFYETQYEEIPECSNGRIKHYKSSEPKKETIETSNKVRSESKRRWFNRKNTERDNLNINDRGEENLGRSHRMKKPYDDLEFEFENESVDPIYLNDEGDVYLSSSISIESSFSSKIEVFKDQIRDAKKRREGGKKPFQKTITFSDNNDNKKNAYEESYKTYTESFSKANNNNNKSKRKDKSQQTNKDFNESYRRLSSGDEMSNSPKLRTKKLKIPSPSPKSKEFKRRFIDSKKLIDYNTDYMDSDYEQIYDSDKINIYRTNKTRRGYREYHNDDDFVLQDESFHRKQSNRKPPKRRPIKKSYDLVKAEKCFQQSDNSFSDLPNSKPLSSKRTNLKKTTNVIKRYVMPDKKAARFVNDSKYITTSQYIEIPNKQKPEKNSPKNRISKKLKTSRLQASSECLLPVLTSNSSKSQHSIEFMQEPKHHKSKNKTKTQYIPRTRTTRREQGGHFSLPAEKQAKLKFLKKEEDIIPVRFLPFKETNTSQKLQQNYETINSELSISDDGHILGNSSSSEVLIRSEEFNNGRQDSKHGGIVQMETQSSKESWEKPLRKPVKKPPTAQNLQPKNVNNIPQKQQLFDKKILIPNRKTLQTPRMDAKQRVTVKQYMSENSSPPRTNDSPMTRGQNFRDNLPKRGGQMKEGLKRQQQQQHNSPRRQRKHLELVKKDSTVWRYPSSSKQRFKPATQVPPQHAEYILGKNSSPPRRSRYMDKKR